jgi:SAM-dependent methyltransferase
MASDSKQRFSNRVENYVKFRPDYPREILTTLHDRTGLHSTWRIADIGSGTGISTRMFLENGNEVFGVEPNADMRRAGETFLSRFPNFHSIDGSAEETALPEWSIDTIVSAQAFHWFDPDRCKPEFIRILKPGGWCVLIWNERKTGGSPFLEGYEALLKKYSGDYMAVRHERINAKVMEEFFAPNGFNTHSFPNQQLLDLDATIGRCLSSSYAPAMGDPRHEPMVAELRQLFERTQANGRIVFDYETHAHMGKLGR